MDIGVESFDFWTPQRRPQGQNLAVRIQPPLNVFAPQNVVNGLARPTNSPNAWVADFGDNDPSLTLSWPEPISLRQIELSFDTDFDHPMESVLMGHPENVMPFCVKAYRLVANGKILAMVTDNHQTRNVITLETPEFTQELKIELLHVSGNTPPGLFEVRCYA